MVWGRSARVSPGCFPHLIALLRANALELTQCPLCTAAPAWPCLQANSIARWANFSADVRCRDDAPRREVLGLLQARLNSVCERRGVRCEVQQTHDAAPVGGWAGGRVPGRVGTTPSATTKDGALLVPLPVAGALR